jgi:hypothetical protein
MSSTWHKIFCLIIFCATLVKAHDYLLWTAIALLIWIIRRRDSIEIETINADWNMLTTTQAAHSCGWLPVPVVTLLAHLPELLSVVVSPSLLRRRYAPPLMRLSAVQQANGCVFTTPPKNREGRCVILSQHTMFNNDICYNFLALDRSRPYFIVANESVRGATVLFNSEFLPSRKWRPIIDYSQYMAKIHRRLISDPQMQCVIYPQGNRKDGTPVNRCSPFAFTLAFATGSPLIVQAFIGDPGSTRRRKGLRYGVHKMITVNPRYSEADNTGETSAHQFVWPQPKAGGVDINVYHRDILSQSIDMANRCCALCMSQTESLWGETDFFDNHAKVHDVMGLSFEPARSGIDGWLRKLPGKDRILQFKLDEVKRRPYQ